MKFLPYVLQSSFGLYFTKRSISYSSKQSNTDNDIVDCQASRNYHVEQRYQNKLIQKYVLEHKDLPVKRAIAALAIFNPISTIRITWTPNTTPDNTQNGILNLVINGETFNELSIMISCQYSTINRDDIKNKGRVSSTMVKVKELVQRP